jgi:hypothetical protein
MSGFHYPGRELDVFSEAKNWKHYFKSRIIPYIGQEVAEVGAGMGATTDVICDGWQKSWVCLEPDETLGSMIQEKIDSAQLPGCCSLQSHFIVDLKQKFDTILYIDVLEHIKNDAGELLEASRHLTPGGSLIVLAPAFQYLFSEFDRSIGHYRRYDRQSLTAISPPDCQVERIQYLDSLGMATSWVNKMFLKQSKPSLNQILFWDRFLLPFSRVLDVLTGYKIGRSILVVWRKTS